MSEKQLPSGLFVPKTDGLADRVEQALTLEVETMASWAKMWPKKGQAALNRGDIRDCVMLKMRVFSWTQDFGAQVFGRVCDRLGLQAPKPEQAQASRQQRRAEQRKREGRPPLKTLPPPSNQPVPDVTSVDQSEDPAIEPTGTGHGGPYGSSLGPQASAILSEVQKDPLKEFNRKRP